MQPKLGDARTVREMMHERLASERLASSETATCSRSLIATNSAEITENFSLATRKESHKINE